jgi:hypothetical protein
MEAYGFDSVLSQGNVHNENILRTNELIRQSNAARLKLRQEDITNEKNSQSNLEGEQVKGLAETIGGQVATKGKDIEAVGRVGKFAITRAPEIGEAVLNATEKMITPSDEFGKSAIAGLATDTTVGKDALDSAKDFLKANVSVGESIGEKASSIGKLGIASTGLSVGLGVLDAVDDLESGKIEGNNAAERVSNVAGMVSGGLEAVGTALDLTGVGAPVGVALNLLGGLAGLAGGVSDIVGEEKEKEKSLAQQKTLQKAPVPQEKLQSLVATGTAGAQVKQAQ